MLMTEQEVFNKVVSGLASQGFQPSYTEGKGYCLYRKDQTATCKIRCGIGHLIPDDKYGISLETCSVRDVRIREAAGINHLDEYFSVELQTCHDSVNWVQNPYGIKIPEEKRPQKMRSNLIAFAIKYNLEIPPELAVDASLIKDGGMPAQTP
jgi:hypothetical protein